MAVIEPGEIFAGAPTIGGRFKAFGKVLLFLLVTALLAAGLTIGGLLIMHMKPQDMAANPSAPASLMINEVGLAGGAVIATVLLAVVFREPIGRFGFGLGSAARRRGRDLLLGVVTGFLLLTALLGLIAALGGYDFGHIADTPMQALQFGGLYLLLFSLVAVGEEFLVRGYALVQMSRAINFWPAALLLSVLFGAMHAGNAAETPVGLASAGIIGFVFCYSFYRSGSLMWALGFHAAWDYAQSFVWGVPDSGIVTPGALFTSAFHGAAWLTGGSAGPEASWLIAPIVLAAMAAAHFMLRPPARGGYR